MSKIMLRVAYSSTNTVYCIFNAMSLRRMLFMKKIKGRIGPTRMLMGKNVMVAPPTCLS